MKLIIDIDEEMYKEYVLVCLDRGNGKTITYNLLKAIKNGTPLNEWLNSFDTNSATKCFEAVNLLKQKLEVEE